MGLMSTMRNYVGVQNGKIKKKKQMLPQNKAIQYSYPYPCVYCHRRGEEGSLINRKHFLKLAKTPWLLEMDGGMCRMTFSRARMAYIDEVVLICLQCPGSGKWSSLPKRLE